MSQKMIDRIPAIWIGQTQVRLQAGVVAFTLVETVKYGWMMLYRTGR